MKKKMYFWGTYAILSVVALFFVLRYEMKPITEHESEKKFVLPSETHTKELMETNPFVEVTGTYIPTIDMLDNNKSKDIDKTTSRLSKAVLATQSVGVNQFLTELEVQDILGRHPAYQSQAMADQKAITEYWEAFTEYHGKYKELNKEWHLLHDEYDKLMDIPISEIEKWPKDKIRLHLDKLNQNEVKMKEHSEKEKNLEESKPIYPQAASDRYEKVQSSMPNTFNQSTNEWETR